MQWNGLYSSYWRIAGETRYEDIGARIAGATRRRRRERERERERDGDGFISKLYRHPCGH
jgi:hypothetical protein